MEASDREEGTRAGTRIVVLHRYYGCDSGCCGHAVEVDGNEALFKFGHPHGPGYAMPTPEDVREYIKEIVTEACGEAHVADIDWDNCVVSAGMGC